MIVGITGGIGSGKTTVSKVFKALGIAVYNSDLKSKSILTSNKSLKQELVSCFGEEIYNSEGINRKYFASIIFSDKELLNKSNKIIHPYVKRDFKEWVNKQKSAYVIKESAILFETGIYKQLDKIILVKAPKKQRIQRVLKRDSTSKSEVLNRISNQWSDNKKKELSDFIINNEESKMILDQVLSIHNIIESLIK